MTRSFPRGLALLIGLASGRKLRMRRMPCRNSTLPEAETSDTSSIGEMMASCVADEEHARDELAPQWRKFAGG
jgi:hypothetical protein